MLYKEAQISFIVTFMPVAKPNNGIAQFSSVHLSISFVCSLSCIEQDKEKEEHFKNNATV